MLPLLLSAPAFAAAPSLGPALVVWLERDVPDESTRAKAARLAGGSKVEQVAWSRLAFGPPLREDPKGRYDQLDNAFRESMSHWEEFEAEPGIARALDAAVGAVSVVRDEKDRAALVNALIVTGAAITKPFEPSLFASLSDTAPFRTTLSGKGVVKPWMDALALDPKRVWTRADFPDARSFGLVQRLQGELDLLPRGVLALPDLPPGTTVYVDGAAVEAGASAVDLAPGHHYVHAMVGGSYVGAQELDIEAGGRATLEPRVNRDELDRARSAAAGGSTDVGSDVAEAIKGYAQTLGGNQRVFLARLDDNGRAQLLGQTPDAVVQKDRPVTAIMSGEIGGGVLDYDGWSAGDETSTLAPAFGGDLGFELGIYYACIQAGASILITPTYRMSFGATSGGNTETPAYAYPHGGIGVYLPRPQNGKASFLIAGKYGYFVPGILGGAVSLSSGVPIGNGNWVRITLEGFRGTPTEGFPGTVATGGQLRVGFASLL